MNTVTTLLVLLSFTNCLPVDKHSPHCKVSKIAQTLIRQLLPMSLTLGGNVYRSYTKIVSFIDQCYKICFNIISLSFSHSVRSFDIVCSYFGSFIHEFFVFCYPLVILKVVFFLNSKKHQRLYCIFSTFLVS